MVFPIHYIDALQTNWIPGYFLFLSMFGKLNIYCVLGTFVQIAVNLV